MQRCEEEGSVANCRIREKVKCKWNEWIKMEIVREKSEQQKSQILSDLVDHASILRFLLQV